MNESAGTLSNRSIERAATVLKLFKNVRRGLTFTEILQESKLPKATVFRVVNTLLALDFLSYNDFSRRYELGPEVLQLGLTAMKVADIYSASHPAMERLQLSSGQSVVLYVRRKMYKVCMAKIEKEDGVSYAPEVGCPLPLWRGSSGMILLSEFELPDLDDVIEHAREAVKLEEAIPIESIRCSVSDIKQKGYCYSKESYGYGVVNLAVPIKTYGGRIIGSLNLAGAESDFSEANREKWIGELKLAAEQISNRIGYNGEE